MSIIQGHETVVNPHVFWFLCDLRVYRAIRKDVEKLVSCKCERVSSQGEGTSRLRSFRWLFEDVGRSLMGLNVAFLDAGLDISDSRCLLKTFHWKLRTSAPGSAFGPSKVIQDPLGRRSNTTQAFQPMQHRLQQSISGFQSYTIFAYFCHPWSQIQNWSWGNHRSICCGWVPAMLGSIVCRACFSSWNFGGGGCKTLRFPLKTILVRRHFVISCILGFVVLLFYIQLRLNSIRKPWSRLFSVLGLHWDSPWPKAMWDAEPIRAVVFFLALWKTFFWTRSLHRKQRSTEATKRVFSLWKLQSPAVFSRFINFLSILCFLKRSSDLRARAPRFVAP